MRIVFDEVTGTVAEPPRPAEEGASPKAAPAQMSPLGKPVELTRALRVLSERKARLFAS